MPHGDGRHVHVDFGDHQLHVGDSRGHSRSFALEPMSVAGFYQKTMATLEEMDLAVDIWPPDSPFPEVPVLGKGHVLADEGDGPLTGLVNLALQLQARFAPAVQHLMEALDG